MKAKKLTFDSSALQEFFESEFMPWQILTSSTNQGLITSYYEPLLQGHQSFSTSTPYPIYGIPRNMWLVPYPKSLHKKSILIVRPLTNQKMITVPNKQTPDKNEWILYPQKFWHNNYTTLLSARMVGNELIPYYTRYEIHQGQGVVDMPVLGWLENWVDLAYLQIQGSGRIQLENGQIIRLSYAAQNGHPFVSLAKWLIQHKKLSAAQVSKAGIKNWLQKHPASFNQLLAVNPNYIFFQKTDIEPTKGPIGALGVSLTEKLSVAVDAHYIPFGSPIYIATNYPLTNKPLNQLVFAQDKGSEIKGPLRVDWFWGFGEQAGSEAEKIHQLGNIWLLLPNKVTPYTAEF
jgi:membrane-bound lytic murein transglycosylase A